MISVMMIKEDIEDIIWRDYQGICSEEEKLSLQEWIEASEKNRLVFEQIRSIIESGELVKGYDVLNEQNALEKVMRRIKPRSIHRYVWLRYAAGILLPLILVAIAYYFMAPNETMESPVIAHQIQPGMSKATLYLFRRFRNRSFTIRRFHFTRWISRTGNFIGEERAIL